jgi:uncharacterized protein (DUF58 family)
MRRFLRERLAAWVRRRQGPDSPPVTLHRRRIYILPTRAGIGFGLLVFFMLIAGLNYANSMTLFLAFLFAGFGLVSMHQCHRNLLGLSLVSAEALPVFAGQPGTVQVAIAGNATFMRHRIEALIGDAGVALADIPPGAQRSLAIAVAPAKRGLVRIDRIRIASRHPYGLFRAWTWVHLPLEMIVYPRPQGALPMPAIAGPESGAQAIRMTGTDEWLGLRPFRDGDSPRQVAWKAYARGAPLLVKEYSAIGSELRVFDFHVLTDLHTETRLEQLARWVVDAEARGERYAVILPGEKFEAEHGHEHRHRCLTALALHGIKRDSHGKAPAR